MTAAELLTRVGLAPEGVPPSVLVTVAGHGVRLSVEEQGDVVHLSSVAALGTDPPEGVDAGTASLGARGDTTVSLEGRQARGRRTLVAPADGVLYDALYELAKATVSTVLSVEAVAGLLGEVAPPEPPAAPTAPEPRPVAATGPSFWFYVEAPVTLVAVGDPQRGVGTLQPGSWYEGRAVPGGWVETCDDRGTPGWVAATSAHAAG